MTEWKIGTRKNVTVTGRSWKGIVVLENWRYKTIPFPRGTF